MDKEKIRDFVIRNFYVSNVEGLQNSQSLLDAGIIDSTGVLEIIAFLEEEYNITVNDDEMLPENLDSIENIARYVDTKKGVAAH